MLLELPKVLGVLEMGPILQLCCCGLVAAAGSCAVVMLY